MTVEPTWACYYECEDALNAAVKAKIDAIATAMKSDLIDNERHMHLLRDNAPSYRKRMQALVDAAPKPSAATTGSTASPGTAAGTASGSGT